MDLIKKSIAALVLLLVVVLAWVGFSVYYDTNDLDVDPNASSYTKQLQSSFDTESLTEITERTEQAFPVSPDEFLSLIGED